MTPARIKICGLTRQEDVSFAESMGAWALGFIFYKNSPRYISPDRVGQLMVRSPEVLKVGVFVDVSKEEILQTVKTAKLTAIQLHGDETPAFCSDLKSALSGQKLIKAFRLQSEDELSHLPAYSMCDARLVDAFEAGKPGGTGRLARWDLATKAKVNGDLILSGGLNTDNIAQALGQVRPYGFDVSSGVENSPGIKDHAKIRSFFQTVRVYEEQS
jgi:phosphoribosylanthranilate isomerase